METDLRILKNIVAKVFNPSYLDMKKFGQELKNNESMCELFYTEDYIKKQNETMISMKNTIESLTNELKVLRESYNELAEKCLVKKSCVSTNTEKISNEKN